MAGKGHRSPALVRQVRQQMVVHRKAELSRFSFYFLDQEGREEEIGSDLMRTQKKKTRSQGGDDPEGDGRLAGGEIGG